jgi:hypothetical protein
VKSLGRNLYLLALFVLLESEKASRSEVRILDAGFLPARNLSRKNLDLRGYRDR